MNALHDEVARHRSDARAMADLAASCGIGSVETATRAYDLAVVTVLDAFSDTVESSTRATMLHTLAVQLPRPERERPATLFATPGHGLGKALVGQLFGSELASVQADVARAAGLGTADTLIEITSLVALASAAGPAPATATKPVFVALAAAAGAGSAAPPPPPPPLGAATPAGTPPTSLPPLSVPVPVPVPVSSAPEAPLSAPTPLAPLVAPTSTPPGDAAMIAADSSSGEARATVVAAADNDDDRPLLGWLLGAAVIGLLLIGGFALFGTGDDSDPDPLANVLAEQDADDADTAAEEPIAEPVADPVAEPGDDVTVEQEPPVVDVGGTEAPPTEQDGAEPADTDGSAIDFVGLDEDPDVEVMAIPLRDITDPERDASGVLEFAFDTATGEICYGITSNGITDPYAGHIHAGDFGVKGGIVVELGQLSPGDSACVDNLPVDTNAILANPAGHYAEIHDAGGEWTLRGQLTERVAGDVVTLTVPMTDTKAIAPDAEGLITFDFNTVSGEICYAVESTNVTGPYSSHIHVGPIGVKGGIVVELGQLESGDERCVDNNPIDTNDILADPAGHYAELHDAGDEWTVRGQLSNTVADQVGGDSDVDEPEVVAVVDADGGGAFVRLEGASIFLEGAVADQATADELADSLANVDDGTPVVNNLVIDPDAPLPSGRIVIADTIFFDAESSVIQGINESTLVAIAALANSQPGSVLTVVGHTDSEGSDVANLELSLRRATASRDLLIDLGLPEENLRIRGAGETAPIGDNATAEGRAQNRRIEFELAPPT